MTSIAHAGLVSLQARLTSLAKEAATALCWDVCSIYLREGDMLVLRGTFGLPAHAVGRVRMNVAEGLTGTVFTKRQTVAIASIDTHPRYKATNKVFADIGEEKLKSFLGVPLLSWSGVLVFQATKSHFHTTAEITAAEDWAFKVASELPSAMLGAPAPGANAFSMP